MTSWGRLPKQALAWYASTVTDAADSQPRPHGQGGPGDRWRARRRRGHQRRLRRPGCDRCDVRAPPGRRSALRVPRLRRPRRRGGRRADRGDRRAPRPTRCRGQQRGRLAVRPRRGCLAKFSRKIIELNLLGPLSVSHHANAVMQTQDARRIDHQHLQRQRPQADSRHGSPTARPRPVSRASPAHWRSSGRRRCG